MEHRDPGHFSFEWFCKDYHQAAFALLDSAWKKNEEKEQQKKQGLGLKLNNWIYMLLSEQYIFS